MIKEWTMRRSRRTLYALGASALVLAVIGPMNAFASHPEVSLPNSNFEIDTDANLVRDDAAPSIDWASVQETRKTEAFTGSQDESFGQGTKEDTAIPSVVGGGIPPNKSDLKSFGVYQEGSSSSGFLHMFWSRVQDPSGTTNMDFEFNQNTATNPSGGNGITPVRKAGDLLITYDLSKGGTDPHLSVRTWSGTAWGAATDLTASNKATGSINSSPIPAADSDGLGDLDPRTFGEASINLAAILPTNQCTTFASVYLKSRASDSFTSALKDFVPPIGNPITNCGEVRIHKDDNNGPLGNAEFTLYVDNAPFGPSGTRGSEDTATTFTCTTGSDGNCTISNVLQGKYWVVETATPSNHQTAADQHITMAPNASVNLQFFNPLNLGAIKVTKTRKHAADGPGDHPHSGVNFTVNGVTKATDTNGVACFDGLPFESYTVHEQVLPGYLTEGDKTVTVDNNASCSGSSFAGEPVSFSNIPLTDITVSVDSQINGGTASTITCTGKAPVTTGTNGDGSVSLLNLPPGTYTCQVVVDP
jgi:hypothetical protein